MKILFFQNDLNPSSGGIARVSCSLGRYFVKQGHDVYFMYYLSDYDEIDSHRKCKYVFTMDEKLMYSQIEDYLEQVGGVDVVIVQALFFSPVRKALVRLREQYHFKIIACLHSNPKGLIPTKAKGVYAMLKDYGRRFLGRTVQNVMRAMYKESDCFVLLSASFEKEMSACFHINANKGYVAIANPLTYNQFATSVDISNKEKVVLIVSRLHESQKNIKSALRIWKKLEDSGLILGWTLRLAGYGDDEKELLDYANFLKLRQFVFLGRTNNPLPLYQKASLFMMTSRFEGFGITLTESLQNGVVPIAFNSFSAVQDILEEGVNGFLIKPFDEDAYAEKLLYLMTNKDRREKMAIAGVERAKRFSIENIGKEWEKLFQRTNQEA